MSLHQPPSDQLSSLGALKRLIIALRMQIVKRCDYFRDPDGHPAQHDWSAAKRQTFSTFLVKVRVLFIRSRSACALQARVHASHAAPFCKAVHRAIAGVHSSTCL